MIKNTAQTFNYFFFNIIKICMRDCLRALNPSLEDMKSSCPFQVGAQLWKKWIRSNSYAISRNLGL